MMGQHIIFDVAAWLAALGTAWLLFNWRFRSRVESFADRVGAGYFVALTSGGLLGAYGFGTLNAFLSGHTGVGRSILGGLVGAILFIELYKLRKGVRGSTGAVLALPFCIAIAIGRIGCFTAGLDDYTYGIATAAPWGVDFGDAIARHPVQLYEAVSMSIAALVLLAAFWRRSHLATANAFYATMFVYAAQRFAWEFFKPYATLLGPLNLFHLLCMALLVYSVLMMYFQKHADA
jgi:prolipoprotein diacylglyceryltransferase